MKLTLKEKIAYGLGAVGKDMVYMLSASYILYYYQDVLGVSAVAMGIILLVARVFDAFNDPIMGVLVAKTKTKWGKFRPWLFIGTVTNAIILFLMFAAPPSLNGGGLIAYAAVFYILWGVTYTMMDIPYWSMIPAFTQVGKEREGMSAMARTCAGVGSAIVTIITVMTVSLLGGMATARSTDNVTYNYTTAGSPTTVSVIALDETKAPTGKSVEYGIENNVNISFTASKTELESSTAYNESNTKFIINVDGITYRASADETSKACTIDFAVDDAAKGETMLAIYVNEADIADFENPSKLDVEIVSTRQVERYGYKYYSLLVAIIFVLFTVITCVGIKEKSTVDMKTAGIGEMFKALVQNDQAMTVVVTIVLVNISTYITNNLLIYFFKYDLGGVNWEGNYTLFNTFAGGIQILSMMLIFPFLRRFFETVKIFYVAVFSSVLGYIILLIMALGSVNTVVPFFVPCFFIMAAVGVLNVLCTIFLANTVDYGEIKNNRRDESVIFSMQTFVVKLASGIAVMIASVALSIFNISDSNKTIEAIEGSFIEGLKLAISKMEPNVVASSSIVGLRLTMTLVPILGIIIALIVFKVKYALNDKKMSEIISELKKRAFIKEHKNQE